MTMWVKICGLTTPDAVAAALDAGADAIGFVFAKSVRQVSPDVALRLAAPARGRARCVAVTRHPTQQDIDDIVSIFKPDVLQTDSADFPNLRLPAQLELLPVMRGAGNEKSAAGRDERGDQGRDRAGGDDCDELVVLPPACSSKDSRAAQGSRATGRRHAASRGARS